MFLLEANPKKSSAALRDPPDPTKKDDSHSCDHLPKTHYKTNSAVFLQLQNWFKARFRGGPAPLLEQGAFEEVQPGALATTMEDL